MSDLDTLDTTDGADGQVLDRTANNRRFAPEPAAELAASIDDVEPDDTDDGIDYSVEIERTAWEPSPLRGPLEHFANRPLPTVKTVAMSARWWVRNLLLALAQIVLHFPQITVNQIPHTARGVAIAAGQYARYRGKGRWEEAAYAADAPTRALRVEKVQTAKRGATRLTVLTVVLVTGLVVWCLYTDREGTLTVATLALLALLNLVGRRQAPAPSGVQIMPRSAFTEGAPSAAVIADLTAVLVEQGHDPARLAITDSRVAEYGRTMSIHSPREIAETDVYAIERGLQTYRGAASVMVDPDNAAVTELRLMWTDPLAASAEPLRLPPLSATIADPAVIGYGLGGAPLTLNLMRTNVVIVGSPGSGKSSSLWVLIDYLSCCRDVRLHGIDLSGGPMLSAWGDVFATRATTVAEATELLETQIAGAIDRTRLLAKRSEPSVDGPPPLSENWTPADGMFDIIIIDELPVLANDKNLVALLGEHQRIGRKAGRTSISATQGLDGDTIKSTSLRKYPSTVIMHACAKEDVITALGGGKIKEGWAPHRLIAAEGDTPNDAGKCYVNSGTHTRPVPWRVARLDELAEIHSRAIERMAAGMPYTTAGPDDAPATVDAVVVPDALAELLTVFAGDNDPDFLPTERILAVLNDGLADDAAPQLPQDLGKRLRPHGVESKRPRRSGVFQRGYYLADIVAAAERA